MIGSWHEDPLYTIEQIYRSRDGNVTSVYQTSCGSYRLDLVAVETRRVTSRHVT
jgi:hypothetical protein